MNYNTILKDAYTEIRLKPRWEQFIFGFWLMGPFIFLIERSPADIWVVILGIAFIVKSVLQRDFSWIKTFWVQAVFLFSLTLLLSALLSPMPAMAFEEALLWIRFPLLAIAFAFWFGKNTAIVKLMLIMTGIGMAAMILILAAELYVNFAFWSGDHGMSARLTWPYGDPVSGNYLGKFGLVSILCAAAAISSRGHKTISVGTVCGFLIICFTILTGERMNALLALCTLGLGLTYLNFHRKGFLIAIYIALTSSFIFAISRSTYLTTKFTSNLLHGIINTEESGYIHLWITGLEIFKTSPITGIGTGMFRFMCGDISYAEDIVVRCDNHPHQYYVQLLAETGIIGLVAFVLMVSAIIVTLWRKGRGSASKVKQICFIVPLALFFPIQATGDIFGQWINLMMWFAIALAFAVSYSDMGSVADGERVSDRKRA